MFSFFSFSCGDLLQWCEEKRGIYHNLSIFNGVFHAFYLYLNSAPFAPSLWLATDIQPTIFNFSCVGASKIEARNKFLLLNNLKSLLNVRRVSVLIFRALRRTQGRAGVYDDAIKKHIFSGAEQNKNLYLMSHDKVSSSTVVKCIKPPPSNMWKISRDHFSPLWRFTLDFFFPHIPQF